MVSVNVSTDAKIVMQTADRSVKLSAVVKLETYSTGQRLVHVY
ncbi:hypothetical protein PF002_g14307 [Phytophthora fragariae]|uniref:Uncharacterized protein n=2 Tax=Phytophthora TaxID=4783 RepID=A0A6A4BS61_9STRA|nr:hypothetical protein PR002_g27625 [Phytophthora rubi]KAE9225736.1 hypothetical protein PF002_g14307 [Phytophthora fragariae]KAE9277732.1 hypothetical protein PR003_g28709 [Phytophthora rubi]